MAQPLRRRRARRVALGAGAAAAALVATRGRLSPVRVEGDSMMPTLPPGSLVAVAPVRRDPRLGAVVVVRRPDGSEHLKRVVGVAGDRLQLGDGSVLVLEAGRFAVAGDNRDLSTDSRHYGPIGRGEIASVARVCYWPPRCWRILPG